MGIRRGQALGLAFTIVIIYFLFFAGSDSTDFRRTTEASLSRRRGVLRGSLSDADLTAHTNRELQRILDSQKALGDQSALNGDDDEIAIAGRVSMPKTNDKPKYPVASSVTSASDGKGEGALVGAHHDEDEPLDGESMAREELQAILKKSPSEFFHSLLDTFLKCTTLTWIVKVIIFSKSYCPYSKRAKALLLETYTISPTPYVVELDLMNKPIPRRPQQHKLDQENGEGGDAPPPTIGRKLQDLLASLTGRRTVPNIMINAQSLGGSDDIARMHADGTLADEIKKMGGKRIVSVEKSIHSQET